MSKKELHKNYPNLNPARQLMLYLKMGIGNDDDELQELKDAFSDKKFDKMPVVLVEENSSQHEAIKKAMIGKKIVTINMTSVLKKYEHVLAEDETINKYKTMVKNKEFVATDRCYEKNLGNGRNY